MHYILKYNKVHRQFDWLYISHNFNLNEPFEELCSSLFNLWTYNKILLMPISDKPKLSICFYTNQPLIINLTASVTIVYTHMSIIETKSTICLIKSYNLKTTHGYMLQKYYFEGFVVVIIEANYRRIRINHFFPQKFLTLIFIFYSI